MNNIEEAKERLKNGASLVLYDGKEFIEENGKGLSPLLKLSLIHISEPTRPY